MKFNHFFLFALFATLSFSACEDDDEVIDIAPVTFDVTIANVSTPGLIATERAMGTNPLSPPVYAVYNDDDNPMFEVGDKANEGTERIAEDGVADAMVAMLADDDDVSQSGVVVSPGGPDDGPALFAGESVTFSITGQPGDRLQFESMFVQSNDWFYSFVEDGVELFNGATPVSGNLTSSVRVYDAGTEEDTAPGTGPTMEPGPVQKPVQDPMATDVGTDEDEDIQSAAQRHPGFTIPATESVITVTITPRS